MELIQQAKLEKFSLKVVGGPTGLPFIMQYFLKIPRHCGTKFANSSPSALKIEFKLLRCLYIAGRNIKYCHSINSLNTYLTCDPVLWLILMTNLIGLRLVKHTCVSVSVF
jgi:hypothetical protein